MKQTKLTHHFDVIKKEPVWGDERIPRVILEPIDIKQEYHYKEELDVPWDEGDNDFDKISSGVDGLTMTEEIEKTKELSDTDFGKSLSPQRNGITRGALGICQNYRRFCPKCNKIESDDAKRTIPTCKNCNKKWHYECKKCSKKLSSYHGIDIHIRSKHLKKGYYYACMKCNYKSVSQCNVKNHLQKIHFISRTLEYMQKFESHDIQNDVKKVSRVKKTKKHVDADFDADNLFADQNENPFGTALAKNSLRQHYRKFCPKCNKIEPANLIKKSARCKPCDTKWNYECKICSIKITTPQNIRKHLKRMCLKRGYYFACLKCNFKGVTKADVRKHLRKIHSIPGSDEYIKKFESENVQNDIISSAKHKCEKCEKQFRTLAHLLKHVQDCGQPKDNANSDNHPRKNLVQDNSIHYCVKCNATVKDDKVGSFYNKKCRNCDSKFSYKCKLCDRIYNSHVGMASHLKSRHNFSKEVLKCPECDYVTNLLGYLAKHVRHKHVKETHECPKCGGKYKNRSLYKIHALQCKKAPEFQCDHCSFKSKKKMYLKDHIHRAHFKGKRVDSTHKDLYFNCDDCSYKSRFKRDIIRHVGIHLKDNIKVCPECKKRFTAHYLQQHVKYCGKESSKCKHCDYRASTKDLLMKHIANKHSKGQEKECPKCHRTWKYNGYLKAHLKHCGIKAHLQCDHCSYKTNQKGNLRVHIESNHLKKRRVEKN